MEPETPPPTTETNHSTRLQCRMYEEKFPEVDSAVMVNVRQIADIGAYVHLLEYNNIEGMIQLSEFSRRRIKSIQKLVRVGKNEVVVVMRVDKDKGIQLDLGYIDLSKRRASAEEIAMCEERFTKSKAVHGIMRQLAERLGGELEELYTLYGWPLYRKYGHAFEAFKIAISQPESVFDELEMPDNVKNELVSLIRRRLTPQPMKMRADIECTCFGYEGIDAIKAALLAGEGCSTQDVPIKIKLVAPPLYVMITNCVDKNKGIATLEKAITTIEERVRQDGGNVVVKMKPRAVSETDDAELKTLMDKLAVQNAEVAGDDDEEELDDLE